MKLKDYLLFAVLGVLLFLNVIETSRNDDLKHELELMERNHEAEMDAVRKTQEGQHRVFSKLTGAYGDIKDLKKMMPEMWQTVKDLKNRKNIKSVNNITQIYEPPPVNNVPTNVEKLDSNRFVIDFRYVSEDSTRVVAGNSIVNLVGEGVERVVNGDTVFYYVRESINLEPENTQITEDRLRMDLTVGIRRVGKYDEIFVIPPKNVTITDIEGARYYRKEKKWGLGVYGGYGAYYDPIRKQFGSGLNVGLSVQYNFLRW